MGFEWIESWLHPKADWSVCRLWFPRPCQKLLNSAL